MRVKKTLFKLLVAAVAAVPVVASAQTSSINAFSPYTMYGIGELNTQGTLITRSMGGAGVAMRNAGAINLLNPASYSTAIQKSFLFDFGVEGQNYYNSHTMRASASTRPTIRSISTISPSSCPSPRNWASGSASPRTVRSATARSSTSRTIRPIRRTTTSGATWGASTTPIRARATSRR